MERIKIVLSLLGLLCSNSLAAQLPQTEHQIYAISSAGWDTSYQSGSIEMQLGGLAIHSLSSDHLSLTQGTLQPELQFVIKVEQALPFPAISISPNPVQTHLHLDDPRQLAHEIHIVNTEGRLVGKWFPHKQAVYEVTNLAAGYYQFLVFSPKKFLVLKGSMVKQGP